VIGVLALQGDFEKHRSRLRELGADATFVSKKQQLEGLRGIILPGGESSVLLKLSSGEFRSALRDRIAHGLPTLATCAGLIFLAKRVENPKQESLGLLDVTVCRNAYGRQKDSFIDPSLRWTEEGHTFLRDSHLLTSDSLEGVFIRAPKISSLGSAVSTLAERQGEPILVRQENILAMSFHPELSPSTIVHKLFLDAFCQAG